MNGLSSWERIADEIHAMRFSYGFVKIIEAFEGELWQVDAMKDGERWVVKGPTLEEAFRELRAKCEAASCERF